PSQSVPREVHLTDDPGRHGTELFVEDVHTGIRRGNSDRYGERAILLHVVAVNHATDRGLGRAILVVDLYRAAEVLGDLARQLSFEILAAHDELADPRGAQVHVLDHREVRGRKLDDVYPAVLDDLEDRHAGHPGVFANDDDAATGNERREDRRHGEIKRQRGEQRPEQAFARTILVLGPPDVIDEAAVLDHHAFRRAGGARGVDDVGEAVGRDRGPGIRDPVSCNRGAVGIQRHHACRAAWQAVDETRLGHQYRQSPDTSSRHVMQHEGDALARRRRIDGHVGGAGLEYAEYGRHHLDRVLHTKADEVIRADAQGAEMRRHLVAAVVELAIGQ